MKKSKSKFCSHCGDLIPEGKEEFRTYGGLDYHLDHLTCIGNLKVTVENLRRKLIEINSITNNIP